MEKEVYLTILFDYYGSLLTEGQKEYFENYYFKNLSLSEISENMNVSRNAIHKQLKVIEEKLKNYEDNLHLYEKDKKLNEIIESLDDSFEEVKNRLKELL